MQSDGSSADSDSVGNVKKLPTFSATRALFENASFASPTSVMASSSSSSSRRGGTPAKSVTPSGIVSEMRAKREAACNQQEVSSPPPVSIDWNSQSINQSITHTHTQPFNGPFSGTTRVSRYQQGKTNLDFTEVRDSEWQWYQLGHNASLHLAPDR